MKTRILSLLLALLLLSPSAFLVSCGRARFELDTSGDLLTDSKTDRTFVALSPAFEPARSAEALGFYRQNKEEVSILVIPTEDQGDLLTDGATVFCALDPVPAPSELTVTDAIFCMEDSASIEVFRFSKSKDADKLLLLRSLFFDGEDASLPLGAAKLTRRVKLVSEELPLVYYCFDYYKYEDGSAFFYERFSGRTVAIPAEADALFEVK